MMLRMSAGPRLVTLATLDALPGLVHGFEQRLGPAGWESRQAGRARMTAALAPVGRLLLLKQVHGIAVQSAPWEGTPEADASVAEVPGLLLGIETADCLPVLLIDPQRRAVAAAHAGWRGTAAGVTAQTVAALVARGSDPGDLLAALGPGIGPCCYQVGPELRQAFGPGGEEFFGPGSDGRPHLDLRAANRRQLLLAGLRAERIVGLDDCTSCLGDRYHSFRREGKGSGRMISFVGFSA